MAGKKRVLLIIGGGIAAYKSLELIRRLREREISVRVILTAAGKNFVTPLSASSLSGDKVYEDLFSLTDEADIGHIQLSRDADLVVVAPATADLLAKAAHGLANDLASTVLLATDKKVLVAPTMNVRMWDHPATQRNISTLKADGYLFVGPNAGDMACGEFGSGRMSEPSEILLAIENALSAPAITSLSPGSLKGLKILVTSGPTREPIDPVRYLTNQSSGKQGHAIAAAAAAAGAEVVLVSGPVDIQDPTGVRVIHVETAAQMYDAVHGSLPADVFIGAAAVADWRPETLADTKIKKSAGVVASLALVENKDILASVASAGSKRPKLVIGFAAETTQVLDYGRRKLDSKGCDIIVANDVSAESGVLGGDLNTVHIIQRSGTESWPKMRKSEIASRLVDVIGSFDHGDKK